MAILFSDGPKYILTSNKHSTVYFPFLQDSASLKVSLSCTPNELMEQALKKWLTTHGSEDAVWRGQYILRVSQCLEFLGGDHPLIQYKVSGCTSKLCLSVCEWLMNFNINLHVSLSGSCTDIADTVFLKCCCCCIVIPIGRAPQLKVKKVTATHQSLFSDRKERCLQVQLVWGYTRTISIKLLSKKYFQ